MQVIASYGPKGFIVFHVLMCLVAAVVITLFLLAAKRTDRGCQQDSLLWTNISHARRTSKQDGVGGTSAQYYLRMQYADFGDCSSELQTPHSETSSLHAVASHGNGSNARSIIHTEATIGAK